MRKFIKIVWLSVCVMICIFSLGTKSEAASRNKVQTSITKLESKSKGFKVTWKKKKGIKGYQIAYGTNKKSSNMKTVTISKSSIKNKTISNLKGCNKKYYVKIRTYIYKSGKKIYSSWSKVKTVTTLQHSFSKATCTTAKKCIRCGTTSGSALGHDYKKGVCSRCQAKDLNYVPSKYEQNLQVLKGYILANGLGSSGDYKFIYTTDKRQLSSYSIYICYYMKEDMIEFQLTSGSTEWLDFKVSQIENSDIKVSYRERSSSKYNPKVIALASATINTNTYDGLSDIFFEYTLDEYGDESQATPNYYLRIGVENWKKLLLKANLTMNDLGFVSCK